MPTTPSTKRLTRASMLLCATLTLSACETLTGFGETDPPDPIRGADTFCSIAEPITWSTRDTDETIRGVKEHNAVGKRLCGWQGAD